MSMIRQPAVAGLFYPAEPQALRREVDGLLAAVPAANAEPPKAVIVPHAGYPYSGPIAAVAYARFRPFKDHIRRVVVLGPSHRLMFHGLALPNATEFSTPLGTVRVDQGAVAEIKVLPQVQVMDRAHDTEHSLEVQLPFLQRVLDEFTLVPLAVGEAGPEEVAAVLEILWGGEETLIVISSDLSHYHDYLTARRIDMATTARIEALQYESVGYEDACGRDPINGLLYLARRRGLKATTLDLRNSGDTSGDRRRVVGYGAYAFH